MWAQSSEPQLNCGEPKGALILRIWGQALVGTGAEAWVGRVLVEMVAGSLVWGVQGCRLERALDVSGEGAG